MSDAPGGDAPTDGTREAPTGRNVVAATLARPRLFVPFVLVGVLAVGLDALLRADPIPVVPRTYPERGLHVHIAVLPELWTTVSQPLRAFVGLRARYLLYVGTTTGLTAVTTALATGYVVAWYLDRPRTLRRGRLVRLAGYGVAVAALTTLLALVAAFGLFAGLLAIVAHLYLTTRLFAAPGYLLDGASVRGAVGRSVAATRGHGLSVVVFVVLVGVAGYLLVSVPVVGPMLATTLAGTVHAVGVARCYRRVATPTERGTAGDALATDD